MANTKNLKQTIVYMPEDLKNKLWARKTATKSISSIIVEAVKDFLEKK